MLFDNLSATSSGSFNLNAQRSLKQIHWIASINNLILTVSQFAKLDR